LPPSRAGVYCEIVPDEKLVFAGARRAAGPSSTLTGLDDCPHVTATLTEVRDRTDTRVHVELPAGISEDRVRELSAMGVRDGWRQTVDRLTAELARTSTTA
jgi:uncharacterized protein YndB with AHSA1/START domain